MKSQSVTSDPNESNVTNTVQGDLFSTEKETSTAEAEMGQPTSLTDEADSEAGKDLGNPPRSIPTILTDIYTQ